MTLALGPALKESGDLGDYGRRGLRFPDEALRLDRFSEAALHDFALQALGLGLDDPLLIARANHFRDSKAGRMLPFPCGGKPLNRVGFSHG